MRNIHPFALPIWKSDRSLPTVRFRFSEHFGPLRRLGKCLSSRLALFVIGLLIAGKSLPYAADVFSRTLNSNYILGAAENVAAFPPCFTSSAEGGYTNDNVFQTNFSGPAKIILAWTTLYRDDDWFGFPDETSYAEALQNANCIFIRDKARVLDADLVVFHGCFQKRTNFSFPRDRHPQQRYVYITTESPASRYCQNEFLPADDVFNITATYKRDSDIVLSYGPTLKRRSTRCTSSNAAANKISLAFWYMSDCSDWAAKRGEYVLELQKYISVDVFGSCQRLFPQSRYQCNKSIDDTMDRCFLNQSKTYKFYLAFENSICKDYITEKMFRIFQPGSESVPVVLGAPVADYAAVAPPNSFIHVDNFSSPHALASYLKYLDANDAAYNEYHKWRELYYYERFPGRNSIDQHPPGQLLQLCREAHSSRPPRVWHDLKAWFSLEKNCRVVEDVCAEYGICGGVGEGGGSSAIPGSPDGGK